MEEVDVAVEYICDQSGIGCVHSWACGMGLCVHSWVWGCVFTAGYGVVCSQLGMGLCVIRGVVYWVYECAWIRGVVYWVYECAWIRGVVYWVYECAWIRGVVYWVYECAWIRGVVYWVYECTWVRGVVYWVYEYAWIRGVVYWVYEYAWIRGVVYWVRKWDSLELSGCLLKSRCDLIGEFDLYMSGSIGVWPIEWT